MRYLVMIFFVLCSLIFGQSNIDEDSIHFIGQASAFTVGSELVTNGTFAADSGWTKGTGWTTAGGDADCDGSAAGNTELLSTTAITTVTGTVYRVQFEVTVFSAGNVVAVFDGVEVGSDKAAVGVYTTYVAATDVSSTISIIGDLNFIGSIDNVSVVTWVGDLNAGGGCTIDNFTGTLTDYMTATGGVLHHGSILSLADDGGDLQVTGIDWDTVEPKVGGLVNMDFSAALDNIDDGIFKIIAVTTTTISIDGDSSGFSGKTVETWVGGAYPDIATAINDSTLSQDPGGGTGQYRKRYICVNVPMEVDAVTDFVAESSETALHEDDGSRKIIGFYESISVVQPDAGYRVVSDMDEGQMYYAGARKAFNQDESFPVINPNGKWVEWNAKGNDINIIEMNTSNLEFRNLKIHNTIADASEEGLIHVDTANFNITFTNCWFDTASRWQFNDVNTCLYSSNIDCFFGRGLDALFFSDWKETLSKNCIFSAGARTINVWNGNGTFVSCLFYKGVNGVIFETTASLINNIFFDQTSTCIWEDGVFQVTGFYSNNIFSPVAISDTAISIPSGSLLPSGFNNIMYSVTGGGVLTNPIVHNQITPNPPLPVGTFEVDPLFVNPAQGDFRLRVNSPALNSGLGSLFGGRTTVGAWQPYAAPFGPRYRSRYSGPLIYK